MVDEGEPMGWNSRVGVQGNEAGDLWDEGGLSHQSDIASRIVSIERKTLYPTLQNALYVRTSKRQQLIDLHLELQKTPR